MEAIARFAARRRWIVIVGWLVLLVGVGAIVSNVGTAYSDDFKLPDTESTRAYDALGEGFQGASGDVEQIVVRADAGAKVTDAKQQAQVEELLAKVAKLPHVTGVVSPYDEAGAAQVSANGRIAFATVNFDEAVPPLDMKYVERVMDAVEEADSGGEGVGFAIGGNGAEQVRQTQADGSTLQLVVELAGVAIAFIVMLVAFGSFFAALLPLLTAIIALGVGQSVIGLLSHGIGVASFGPQLAALIGLGVGIDYSLFIVTRHRVNLQRGMTVEDSIAVAVTTAGRAVVFAAIIVCIALLGMFLLGVSFLYGVAISASIVVLFTMFASITLLPAFLRVLGMRAVSRRMRRSIEASANHDEHLEVSPGWLRWGRLVQRRKVPFAVVSAVVLLVIAIPFTSLRLGSSDAGNDPKGTTTRNAYDWLSEGFGAGFNGPFQLVARVGSDADRAAFESAVAAVAKTDDVALATPATYSENGKVAISQVYPKSSPQAVATSDLLHELRDDVIPDATRGSGVEVYVGGITAVFEDFASVLANKLPLFIGIVVALSFVLLMLVFRSVLVPLVAAVMNLFAIGASFGIVVVFFQWGWFGSVTGLEGGPIEAFVPVMMFAILFGLSMDYEVFLVSRMHEEWVKRRDNADAVTIGQAETGRVITAAGLIMIFVFASFVTGGERVIVMFSVALASAVLFDAMVIRTMLVPALMHLIGPANWWMPAWLDRLLPNLSIEGPARAVEPTAVAAADAATDTPTHD
ncbi:MAG: hypothetical protein JWN72_493 [Thermoleophilia bacterium]|nr:hypothetical protein [Thermoleophilia bacterium]